MRLDWEVVSGVASVVSAATAVISLGALFWQPRRQQNPSLWRDPKPLFFLLFCSGWVMCVVAYNWLFEPFGYFISFRGERILYGTMLSAPAVILTRYAWVKLVGGVQKRGTVTKEGEARRAD